jgi:phenylacetate-CoA ligase
MLAEAIGLLPLLPKAPAMLRVVMRHPKQDPDEQRKVQNKKLRAMVRHGYENVPYYRRLFKKSHLTPADVRIAEDLAKIPITTKEDLRHLPLEQIVSQNIAISRCLKQSTSGTSGTPFFPYWTWRARLHSTLQVARWEMECGISLTDRIVSIGADHLLSPLHEALSRVEMLALKIPAFESLETQIAEIKAFKPRCLITNPSSLDILAKEIRQREVVVPNLTRILTTGEMLSENTRVLANKVFGADVFDGYGAMEVGGVCTECVEHTGYHIWTDSVVVEIVRDGEALQAGEEGEIAVTNLTNYAMPFIRYNLEDLGRLSEDDPQCGSSLPLMTITTGRKADVIQLPGGILMPAWEVVVFITKIPGVKQFQVIQEEVDAFTINFVKDASFTSATLKKIKRGLLDRVRRRLNRDAVGLKVKVSTVDHIPREKSGKFRYFIKLAAS